jgi:ketosteroid isomerase-like protein
MASLTEGQIRAALDTLAAEGPESLRALLHPNVVWTALDQPGYDCVGRDAVLATLHHATADGSAWQIGAVHQAGAERFTVEVQVRDADGSSRERRLTLSVADGRIVRLEGAPASGSVPG